MRSYKGLVLQVIRLILNFPLNGQNPITQIKPIVRYEFIYLCMGFVSKLYQFYTNYYILTPKKSIMVL